MRFKTSKSEITHIILMDFDMHSTNCNRRQLESLTEFNNEINDKKEIFARLAQCHIFHLHYGQCDLGPTFTLPMNRAAGDIDDITRETAYTVRVL